MQLRFAAPDDGLAHVGQVVPDGAVELEITGAGQVARAGSRIAGHHASVAVGDLDLEYQAGRQQSLGRQRGQRALCAVLFDRVFQHAQGLVDVAQAARHLGFIGVEQLVGGVARGRRRGAAFGLDHVQGGEPHGAQQEQGEQRQRDMGFEREGEPARGHAAHPDRGRRGRRGGGRERVHRILTAGPARRAPRRRAPRARYSRSSPDSRPPGGARRRRRWLRAAAGRGR